MAEQRPDEETIDDTWMGCRKTTVVAIFLIVVSVAVAYHLFARL